METSRTLRTMGKVTFRPYLEICVHVCNHLQEPGEDLVGSVVSVREIRSYTLAKRHNSSSCKLFNDIFQLIN